MCLIYFDENKYAVDNPFFIIGGILLEDKKISEIESAIMQIQYNFFGTNILNKDTIHFTHSHHSRFLQVADLIVYMAGCFENNKTSLTKWHDVELSKLWEDLKKNTDYTMQRWPK